jgi:hypothetical protein
VEQQNPLDKMLLSGGEPDVGKLISPRSTGPVDCPQNDHADVVLWASTADNHRKQKNRTDKQITHLIHLAEKEPM